MQIDNRREMDIRPIKTIMQISVDMGLRCTKLTLSAAR